MKVIGMITPEYEDSEEYGTIVKNGGYVNGSIIAFTPKEAHILQLLQEAIKGNTHNWFDAAKSGLTYPQDGGMDKALWLVYQFIKARFAVNDFAQVVDELENTLMKIDEGMRGELDEL